MSDQRAPRVSVIVPVFNFARYLSDAIESLLAQSFERWECIVADDGSSDDSATVAEQLASRDDRIRCLRLEHRGVSAARNGAIRVSTAEFVQFLDADDRLAPFKLAEQVAFMDAHPETAIVYGNVAYFMTDTPDRLMPSPHGKLTRPILDDRVHGSVAALRKLEHYNFFHPASALARRDILSRADFFNEGTRASEDHELWMNCAILGGRFDHWEREEPVALIRSHSGSASRERGRNLRGLIEAAKAFPSSSSFPAWPRQDSSPLIYEVAIGIDDAERGHRIRGFRRIWRASRSASELLTGLRWRSYALSALVLPRTVFTFFVTMPIPEQALELYRRVRSMLVVTRRSDE